MADEIGVMFCQEGILMRILLGCQISIIIDLVSSSSSIGNCTVWFFKLQNVCIWR